MAEIQQLPEVVNFAGKTISMPGTLRRLWCIYEFAWSIELNSGCLFYGYADEDKDGCTGVLGNGGCKELKDTGDDTGNGATPRSFSCGGSVTSSITALERAAALGVSESCMRSVMAVVNEDRLRMLEPDLDSHTGDALLLSQAHCFNSNDEQYIRETVQEKLGGTEQVARIVKRQFMDCQAQALAHAHTLTAMPAAMDEKAAPKTKTTTTISRRSQQHTASTATDACAVGTGFGLLVDLFFDLF